MTERSVDDLLDRASVEPDAMRRAGLGLIDAYRDLAQDLAKRHGLEYPTRLDGLITRRLAEVELLPERR